VDNVCCGLPHLGHGQWGDFLALARENITLYAAADIIVSDCASCAGTLKHIGGYLAADLEWRQAAEAFSAKIMSLSEYLAKAGYQPRQRSSARITFHEPCHLGRGQGVKKEPRRLLGAAGEFVEMAGADTAASVAGRSHRLPEVADAILEKKRANIEKSGADIVESESRVSRAVKQPPAKARNSRSCISARFCTVTGGIRRDGRAANGAAGAFHAACEGIPQRPALRPLARSASSRQAILFSKISKASFFFMVSRSWPAGERRNFTNPGRSDRAP
jgi:hypothetical protein